MRARNYLTIPDLRRTIEQREVDTYEIERRYEQAPRECYRGSDTFSRIGELAGSLLDNGQGGKHGYHWHEAEQTSPSPVLMEDGHVNVWTQFPGLSGTPAFLTQVDNPGLYGRRVRVAATVFDVGVDWIGSGSLEDPGPPFYSGAYELNLSITGGPREFGQTAPLIVHWWRNTAFTVPPQIFVWDFSTPIARYAEYTLGTHEQPLDEAGVVLPTIFALNIESNGAFSVELGGEVIITEADLRDSAGYPNGDLVPGPVTPLTMHDPTYVEYGIYNMVLDSVRFSFCP